jgi:hypothetical protein
VIVIVCVTVVGTVFVTVCVRVSVTVRVPVTFWVNVDPASVTVFFLVTVTFTLWSIVFGLAETATIRVVPFLVIVASDVAADERESDPMAMPSAAPRIMSSEPPAIVANAFDPRINRSVSIPLQESTLPGAWHG